MIKPHDMIREGIEEVDVNPHCLSHEVFFIDPEPNREMFISVKSAMGHYEAEVKVTIDPSDLEGDKYLAFSAVREMLVAGNIPLDVTEVDTLRAVHEGKTYLYTGVMQ